MSSDPHDMASGDPGVRDQLAVDRTRSAGRKVLDRVGGIDGGRTVRESLGFITTRGHRVSRSSHGARPSQPP
jgi:hypothetical protein